MFYLIDTVFLTFFLNRSLKRGQSVTGCKGWRSTGFSRY